jgi:hypothetical protein
MPKKAERRRAKMRESQMPTHEEFALFLREFARLSQAQQDQFIDAVKRMVEDLRNGRQFRATLRVKGVRGHPGIFEMSWGDGGRATFHYGTPRLPGDTHIVWRRIGGHEIFKRP